MKNCSSAFGVLLVKTIQTPFTHMHRIGNGMMHNICFCTLKHHRNAHENILPHSTNEEKEIIWQP